MLTWALLRLCCRNECDKDVQVRRWHEIMECLWLRTSLMNSPRIHMITPWSGYHKNWKNWWRCGQLTCCRCALTWRSARKGRKTTTAVRATAASFVSLEQTRNKRFADGMLTNSPRWECCQSGVREHQHKRCPNTDVQQPRSNGPRMRTFCVARCSHTWSDC